MEWNSLPADMFPEYHNLGPFKAIVSRHNIGVHAMHWQLSTLVSLSTSGDGGQMSTYFLIKKKYIFF